MHFILLACHRYPHVFTLHCTGHALDLALERIGELDFFKNAIDRLKKIVQLITNSHAPRAIFKEKSALRLLKPEVQNGQLQFAKTACMNVFPSFGNPQVDMYLDMCLDDTRFYTAYISCARLLQRKSAARQTVVWGKWDRWANKPGNRDKSAAVKTIILDEEFWAAVKLFCRLVKPIVRLMRLVDSNMASMGKVSVVLHADSESSHLLQHHVIDRLQYCMQVYPMCAQIQQHIKTVGLDKDLEESVAKIFLARWNKMHSPLHAAAYMRKPQFRLAAFDKEVMHLSFLRLLEAISFEQCKTPMGRDKCTSVTLLSLLRSFQQK